MRWSILPKPKYEAGDKRTVTKFAFLPVKIGTERIWLEKYEALQVLEEINRYFYMGAGLWNIVPDSSVWVTVKRRTIEQAKQEDHFEPPPCY